MIRVDLSDSSGSKLGSGPVTTAQSWSHSHELSRAGSFDFSCAISDKQRSHLVVKSRVQGYASDMTDAPSDVGAGIIESVSVDVGASGTMLSLAGDDLIRELATRTVGNLLLATNTNYDVAYAEQYDPVSPTATQMSFPYSFTLTDGEYFYIGSERPFTAIQLDIGTALSTSAPSSIDDAQYFRSEGTFSGWESLTNVSDDTASGSNTMQGGGSITYDEPSGWVKCTHRNMSYYWIRILWQINGTSETGTLDGITVTQNGPQSADVNAVMAYAPAGWSLDTTDWYSGTDSGTLHQFNGESVLEALVLLAELHGEHFRRGTGKEVEWMRSDTPPSGIRAIGSGFEAGATVGKAEICLIKSLERVHDSADLVTRVYPHGRGLGDARIDLSMATVSMPSGYSISTSGGYIESTNATSSYGQIDAHHQFDIGEAYSENSEASCNQLANAALNWLQLHDSVMESYRLSVTKLENSLKVGETIRVVYSEFDGDGNSLLSIDEQLTVLAISTNVGNSGTDWDVTVANLVRHPVSDNEILVDKLIKSERRGMHNQPVSYGTINGRFVADGDG